MHHEPIELDEVLSLNEAARMLGRSPATMGWAAPTGQHPAKKLGRDWVTTRDWVTSYRTFHRRDTSRRLRTV
jgi:hypothetical protein